MHETAPLLERILRFFFFSPFGAGDELLAIDITSSASKKKNQPIMQVFCAYSAGKFFSHLLINSQRAAASSSGKCQEALVFEAKIIGIFAHGLHLIGFRSILRQGSQSRTDQGVGWHPFHYGCCMLQRPSTTSFLSLACATKHGNPAGIPSRCIQGA